MASSSRAADDGVHLFPETSLAPTQSASSAVASFQQQHHHHLQQQQHDYRLLDHPVNFDPVAGSSSSFYHYGAMNTATASSSTAEEHQQDTTPVAGGMEGSEQYYYGNYTLVLHSKLFDLELFRFDSIQDTKEMMEEIPVMKKDTTPTARIVSSVLQPTFANENGCSGNCF